MARPRFAPGVFLGDASRTVRAGGFRLGLWTAALPPEGVAPHVHEAAHFVLALDGGYRSLARDPWRPTGGAFEPGALVWNPPGVEHADCFERPGGRFLSVSFDPPARASRGDPTRLRQGIGETAARRLIGRVADFEPGDETGLEGLALDLASAVLSPLELEEDPAPDWLLRAHQVIHDLADRPGLEVREVARTVGVHPVSLARRYRRHFGRSPAAAIRQARADRATAGLKRGADLADLAASAGYADQSHLTREFVAVYGLTPGRWRATFR